MARTLATGKPTLHNDDGAAAQASTILRPMQRRRRPADMYQLLFLIHGMGAGARPANDPKWWTGVLSGIRQSAKTYKHDADLVVSSPKAGQVLVVPLTYHQFFDAIRDKWRQEAGGEVGWLPLLQALAFSDPQVVARLPGWVGTAGAFFWTHVVDVLLYRYVAELTVPIRDEVATQIAEAWHRADLDNGANTSVHFVAHSLGTSVLHDAIATLAADPAFSPGTRQITSIVTCANVSGILETNFPAYDSVDRPVDADPPPDGMTAAYFSFRHELDPIAAVKTFRGDLHGWPASGYRDEVAIDVKDWNVHGYSHYMDNPIAHLRLFERIWPTEPWKARRDPAIVAYKASPATPCPAAIAEARQRLKAILSQPLPTTPAGFIDVVAKTVRALQDAKAACAEEAGQ